MTTMRLNKAIANAGVCSRRKADELIATGHVTVNGQTVTELGLQVDPHMDIISVHGKTIANPAPEKNDLVYVLIHKPVQVVTTVSDPEGRTTVIDILPESLKNKRLYPVGRLDYFSEGLLLLTNDGELTHRLTHPRYHIAKTYEVTVREQPTEAMLHTMRKGMTLAEGEKLAPVDVHLAHDNPKKMILTLHQGLNRQIRRMCRDLGLTILTLMRVQLGNITIGTLGRGQCRQLSKQELTYLRKAAGLS